MWIYLLYPALTHENIWHCNSQEYLLYSFYIYIHDVKYILRFYCYYCCIWYEQGQGEEMYCLNLQHFSNSFRLLISPQQIEQIAIWGYQNQRSNYRKEFEKCILDHFYVCVSTKCGSYGQYICDYSSFICIYILHMIMMRWLLYFWCMWRIYVYSVVLASVLRAGIIYNVGMNVY